MSVNDQCPICYRCSSLVHILPCRHSVCEACLRMQLRYDARCAMCKASMTGRTENDAKRRQLRTIIVTANASGLFGLSLKQTRDKIIVLCLDASGAAAKAGLCVGDTLITINGLICVSVQTCIQILKAAQKAALVVRRRNQIWADCLLGSTLYNKSSRNRVD